jgi:hypothetical protein
MRRGLEIDVLECPECGGRMRFVAAIMLASAIRRILRHLGLPSDPVELAPARAPPELDDAWACRAHSASRSSDWTAASLWPWLRFLWPFGAWLRCRDNVCLPVSQPIGPIRESELRGTNRYVALGVAPTGPLNWLRSRRVAPRPRWGPPICEAPWCRGRRGDGGGGGSRGSGLVGR